MSAITSNAIANLQDFVAFSQAYIKGNEKKEAQSFLNAFFQAFGYESAIAAGAEFEQGIAKGSAKGNKGSADLVWSDQVLIEMKSRGENLAHHYNQLERYWMRLTPKPRYSLLCNFDEFWIYDFHNQVDTPVDVIKLDELVHRSSALNFMGKANHAPIFRNNQVEITEKNAQLIGDLYQTLLKRGRQQGFSEFNEEQIQRFILQCVLAMFAEDRELLPKDLFISCVQDCIDQKGSSYDVLGGLFNAMNQKQRAPKHSRFAGVEYFNGGLFSIIHSIALEGHELELLHHCASQRWDQVRPSIFGSIFTSACDPVYRHAHGLHYTSEADIRQIVIPTISEFWEAQIEGANTLKQLQGLHRKLQAYRVLDPACGSGNFLYVAYQELKRVEKRLLDRTTEMGSCTQLQIGGLVSPNQFFGMDTNLFAVQLARVTMMIARKIAIDTFGLTESALPLDTLDHNIVCQDALFSEWKKADAIVGNPPFLGGKHLRLNLGDGYIDRVFEQYPKDVDFCVYWFRKAHETIDETGRVGLVGTNSISQGKSRSASLEYITQNGGQIHTAISTQPWSGEAKVHVSIVNWSKQQPQKYRLDGQVVSHITSSLTAETNVSNAVRLQANLGQCFQGVIPVGKDFLITQEQAEQWIKADLKNVEVLKRFSSGENLTRNPLGTPERWIIDFNDLDIEEASEYTLPFEHLKKYVKPERENNRDSRARNNWWQFLRSRSEMRRSLLPLHQYFGVPEVSKCCVFLPCSTTWLPSNLVKVVASEDFYILGILTSMVHRTWVKAQSSTLKSDTRYTNTTCFETFPFPQTVARSLIQEIRGTMQDLHEYRSDQMNRRDWGITKLYNNYFHEPSSRLSKLHQQLDKLVLQAYGFKPTDNLLDRLLTLNLELARKEKNGETVIGASAPGGDNVDRRFSDRIKTG
ncbi:DNA methyltransferase [Leptolyngbya sp. NIES-2104]|uniref:DNA methyltransferase n=1 Tax=Leptolyngbya sp. NIES-2104 TaxID=1552121 RepID=UPI0006EC9D07|nr:DNA methyltransferase [Leptolyngbya sp. NIES-2104]GAP95041.1 type II restriction enzyme, methylase subunit YeeA [Leptolyngbya sp. NIES-2104]